MATGLIDKVPRRRFVEVLDPVSSEVLRIPKRLYRAIQEREGHVKEELVGDHNGEFYVTKYGGIYRNFENSDKFTQG